jgi:hypothetical protein
MKEQKQDETKQPEKHPLEMNTDEALDYIFGAEIKAELKRQAGTGEPSKDLDSE